MRIGLDLDNTIACYSEAIEIVADEQLFLPASIVREKLQIRDYLRSIGKEAEWTKFQGYLYGPGMVHARPFEGTLEVLRSLKGQGHRLSIISHRSKYPYAGTRYDLHRYADNWIREQEHLAEIFSPSPEQTERDQLIRFYESKKEKIDAINGQRCDIFLDDLPEILECISDPCLKVLFDPLGAHKGKVTRDGLCSIQNWKQLITLVDELNAS